MVKLSRLLLFLFLLVGFTLSLNIITVSFASVNMTYFEETSLSFSKLELANIISDTCFAEEIEDYTTLNSSINDIKNDLLSYLQNDNFNYVYYAYSYDSSLPGISPNVLQIIISNNNFNGSSGQVRTYTIKHYSDNATAYNILRSISNNGNPSLNGEISGNYKGKYYYYNDGTIYKSSQNVQNIAIDLKFIPRTTVTTSLNLNNETVTVYNDRFSRSSFYHVIGDLQNINYFNDIYLWFDIYTGSSFQNTDYARINTTNSLNNVEISTNYVYYNQLYRLNVIYDNNISPPFYFIFSEYGSSYSSGDSITGGGSSNNLVPIQQQIDDNNNFWKDTYNSLWSLSSGDIDDIKNTIEAYFPYGNSGDYGPISIFDQIFGSLNNDPTDFIISWNNIPVDITLFGGSISYSGDIIPGGSINFSKYCRDNETLGVIHTWIIIFSVISFYLLYFTDLYRCLLRILGVATDMLDLPEEEHRQIGFINDWRDK